MTRQSNPGRSLSAAAIPLLLLALGACSNPRSSLGQPTGPSVSSLTLLDAASGQPLSGFDPIVNGATLDLSKLPTRSLNLRANTSGAASVRFSLNGESDYKTSDGATPMLVSPGASWTPTRGQHTIAATAYGGSGGVNPGAPYQVSITVTDPNSGWSRKADAPYPFYEAQGVMLDGKLYLISGFNTGSYATASAYRYDPAVDRWQALKSFPGYYQDAYGTKYYGVTHSATAADEETKTIWMAGGFLGDHPGPSTDQVWKYDVVSDAWSNGPKLPEALGGGALVRLGRSLHFFGGVLRTKSGNTAAYVSDSGKHWTLNLDDTNATWQPAADMPNPRNHMAGAVLGGKIYAIGGQHLDKEGNDNQSTVEVYDPAKDAWSNAADLPQPLSHISDATLVRQGRIVVLGGVGNHAPGVPGEDGVEQLSIYQYDPNANAWETLGQIPTGPRQSPIAGTSDSDGRVIVVGGWNGSSPQKDTWIGTP